MSDQGGGGGPEAEQKPHCAIRALTCLHGGLVVLAALACVGGFGALIENQVNPNPLFIVRGASAPAAEAPVGAAAPVVESLEADVLAIKEKAFSVTTSLCYIFLSVCVIMAQLRIRCVLRWAHFLTSFPGKSGLQLFLGVEVLNSIEQLAAIGEESSPVRDIVTIVGWAMFGCGLVTAIWYGLVLPPPSGKSRFRGSCPARVLALLLLLLVGVSVGFLAMTEGWQTRQPDCVCRATWEHQGRTYRGCATTLDAPGEPWCYTEGGRQCAVATEGLRDPGAAPTEQNATAAWRGCTESLGSGPCSCAPTWSVEGVCPQRSGCAPEPCGEAGNASVWCVVAGPCGAAPAGGFAPCKPEVTGAPSAAPTGPSAAPTAAPTAPPGTTLAPTAAPAAAGAPTGPPQSAPPPGQPSASPRTAGGSAAPTAGGGRCLDTPGWTSKSAAQSRFELTCADYEANFCANGAFLPGKEIRGLPTKTCPSNTPCDVYFNYPGQNCCSCGGGQTPAAPTGSPDAAGQPPAAPAQPPAAPAAPDAPAALEGNPPEDDDTLLTPAETRAPAGSPGVCVDTPGWKGRTLTCELYSSRGYCKDGRITNPVVGLPSEQCQDLPCDAYWNYPAENCCACGKAAAGGTPTAAPLGDDAPTKAPLPDGAPTTAPQWPPSAPPSAAPVTPPSQRPSGTPTSGPSAPPVPSPTAPSAGPTAAPTAGPEPAPVASPAELLAAAAADSGGLPVGLIAGASVGGCCLLLCGGAALYLVCSGPRKVHLKVADIGLDEDFCRVAEGEELCVEDWEARELATLVQELNYRELPCEQSLRSVAMKDDFTLGERIATAISSIRKSMTA
eukprot:TRINITY_DN4603_c0_g1_i2.p1 TRINITY_DN4603_c0_g1~~TRINITY_DN4603_c0_g1_i2.p1  ORF type:complete len:836 (+),score=197.46 TRINITY_DN4603_c0_g1_i2:110-2617(+)